MIRFAKNLFYEYAARMDILNTLNKDANIVILTGAGISAESGLPTFRASDGLWEGHRVEDVATPEAFIRNPALVQTFYNERRAKLLSPEIKPNAAHMALAELEEKWLGNVLIVTQNIDDLHERAGSKNLLHMHGELLKMFCENCRVINAHDNETAKKLPLTENLETNNKCNKCGASGALRPDIVWFGEMPYFMNDIASALRECDIFISIGTSGHVYPAAGFVNEALMSGAVTAELNLEPSQSASAFGEKIYGPATETVPAFVKTLLA